MPRRRNLVPPAPPVVVDPHPLAIEELRLTPGSVHYVRNDAADAMSYMMTASEVMERQRGRGPVQVEFLARTYPEMAPEDRHRREVQVSLWGRHMRFEVQVEPGMPIEHVHRHIVSEAVARFASDLEHELRAQMMQAERNYQHDMVRERERRYHQSGGRDQLRHAWDMARGYIAPPTKNIPLKTWFKHKKFEINGWIATLIETEEQIRKEGESMQHCFASYHNRIAKEEYLAYHISAPEGLPKSGFTLGFRIEKGKFRFDQVKGKKNDVYHCKNPALLAMIETIDKAINKEKPKLDKSKVKEETWMV